jgi:hypothetical protein
MNEPRKHQVRSTQQAEPHVENMVRYKSGYELRDNEEEE